MPVVNDWVATVVLIAATVVVIAVGLVVSVLRDRGGR